MDIEARFRRRVQAEENAKYLNNSLIFSLSKIIGFWKHDKSMKDVTFDLGDGESIAVDLSSCLENGIKAAISYASRLPGSIVDKAISDDFMTIQLDLEYVNYEGFCENIFPIIVREFQPYRAAVVTDLDLDLDDFEEIIEEAQRTGLDVDGRDTVFRFYPMNYFDNKLCKKAFGCEAQDLVSILSNYVAKIEVFTSGLLVKTSDTPVVGENLVNLNRNIWDFLKSQ